VEKIMVKKSGKSGESGEIEKWRNFLAKVEKFIYKICKLPADSWSETVVGRLPAECRGR
jgi:hypothetical protein